MRWTKLKIVLMFMVLFFVIIASRHYSYHGYNTNVIGVLNQQIGSGIMSVTYLLFLLLSLLPLFIELGLIIFLIKNRREIVNLLKDLFSNKGVMRQQKRRNLLFQIIGLLLALMFLELYNNKRALNSVSIESSNSTAYSQSFQNITLNLSYFQQSTATVFTVLNNSLLIAFIVLFSIFLAIVFWAFYTREKYYSFEYDSPEKQLENVVTTTLSNLKGTIQAHSDARSIIIKCYNDMCDIISKAGKVPKTYETAREFEKACLSVFPWIPIKPLHELTLLFEESLYSNHVMDESKANIALNALKEISEVMVVRNANN
jgi:hypothetical protein